MNRATCNTTDRVVIHGLRAVVREQERMMCEQDRTIARLARHDRRCDRGPQLCTRCRDASATRAHQKYESKWPQITVGGKHARLPLRVHHWYKHHLQRWAEMENGNG